MLDESGGACGGAGDGAGGGGGGGYMGRTCSSQWVGEGGGQGRAALTGAVGVGERAAARGRRRVACTGRRGMFTVMRTCWLEG